MSCCQNSGAAYWPEAPGLLQPASGSLVWAYRQFASPALVFMKRAGFAGRITPSKQHASDRDYVGADRDNVGILIAIIPEC